MPSKARKGFNRRLDPILAFKAFILVRYASPHKVPEGFERLGFRPSRSPNLDLVIER
jgi:hypothetical protein